MLIRNSEIDGKTTLDVQLRDGRIASMGPGLQRLANEPVIDAEGGALLPGLHDHHIHLFALAASLGSLRCGPPEVRSADALAEALRAACSHASGDARQWIRGVGYCESVAGSLDRWTLDRWVADRPLRMQHRGGALWVLNSAAIEQLRLDADTSPPAGLERDGDGRPTGRLFRCDEWMRGRLAAEIPSLASSSQLLSRFGVTGLTDATPGNGAAELRGFSDAVETGALQQRLRLMGKCELPQPTTKTLERGAVKIMLDESALPEFDTLRRTITAAHESGREVAIHCVTRSELVFTLSALASAGSRPGDRIEHAAVAPPELVTQMSELGVTVVTQPHFIHERGDSYAADVEPIDRQWLYRGAGFLAARVPLGGGTDAPFGNPDPWLAMRAAVSRRSEAGIVLGAGEALEPEAALALFTTPLGQPGGPARKVAVGQPADLCLLDRPWQAARSQLSSDSVRATLRAGNVVWQRT